MTPALAATLLLLRPETVGFSVFLVKRHRGSAFMPNLWVFPGGRVEPSDGQLGADHTRGGASTGARLLMPPEQARAVLVAGVRETFEEAGLWLGSDAPPDAARATLAAGGVAFADVLRGTQAVLDLDALSVWSRWVTPEGEARRFDTTFLIARAPEGVGRHDTHETVDSGWFTPCAALDAGLEHFGLAPPTWWTLTELASFSDVSAVLAAAGGRDVAAVAPLLDPDAHGFGIALPGHPRHPDPARPGLPTRIGLGDRAWVATH